MTCLLKKDVVATVNYLRAVLLPKLTRRIFSRGEITWLAKVNNLLVPWLGLCWDYIFALLSLWGYPPEEGES